MNWKPRSLEPLEQENNALKIAVVRLRQEFASKAQFVDRLQFLLRRRTETIDDLNGKLEQARAANQKLDAECEHLAELAKG